MVESTVTIRVTAHQRKAGQLIKPSVLTIGVLPVDRDGHSVARVSFSRRY